MQCPVLRLWVLTGILAALCGCSQSSDEEQIRAVIGAAEAPAEARDTSDAMKLVADDYRDDQGNDKRQLAQFLRGYLLVHPKVELLVNIGEIELETATRARVKVEVAMIGTHMIGTQGSAERSSLTGDYEALNVELRKRDSEWLVVGVERFKK